MGGIMGGAKPPGPDPELVRQQKEAADRQRKQEQDAADKEAEDLAQKELNRRGRRSLLSIENDGAGFSTKLA